MEEKTIVEVMVQGKIFIEVHYSEIVEVEAIKDMTPHDIKEKAKELFDDSDLGTFISDVQRLGEKNSMIAQIDFEDAGEEFSIEDDNGFFDSNEED